MKILITGATGFIGKHLTKALLKENYTIYILIRRKSNNYKLNPNIKTIIYNNNLDEIFQSYKFNGIIHLASLFLSEHKNEDISDLINSNIKFGTELLEMSKKYQLNWFINTGTFWQNYKNEEYNPANLYAATKEAFLDIAKYYTQTSNLIFTTLKLNDTFGEGDSRKKIFNLWAEQIKSKHVLKMSKGEQIIDISYIEDVINAYILLIQHLNSTESNKFKNKLFVVTSKEKLSLKELAKLFEKVTNTKLNILWGKRAYRKREVMIPYNKGIPVPGWEPKFTIETAIIKTLGIEHEQS